MAKRKPVKRAAGKRAKRAAGKRDRPDYDADRREAERARKRREREYDDWLYEGYEIEMSVDLYTGE